MMLKALKPGVLALATTAAALAIAGVGAAPARATFTCPGSSISGQGTAQQSAAQAVWTVNSCAPPVRVTYAATSTDQCVNQSWSGNGVAVFDTSVDFCGADEAPTATQITNINASLSGASVLTIPVTQVAIAIVVNPPSGCSISTISAADLERVFRGAITTWAGITGTSGCGTATITRVVRAERAATTYQLKHWLDATAGGARVAPCSPSLTQTWADLQALPATWPCSGSGLQASLAGGTGPGAGTGDGDEVRTVINTTGSIGYAALGAARAGYTGTGQYRWIAVKGVGQPLGINPSTNGLSTSRANANCTTAARSYGGGTLPSGTASWSGVYFTAPGTGYALCTLTWDTAVSNYALRFPGGAGIARTVCQYLGYVIASAGGVIDNTNNDYQRLPTDVQAVAAAAIGGMTC